MKTFGVIFQDGRQELISIVLDKEGNPRIDTLAPYPRSDDWIDPVIIPLVKIEKPIEGDWEPVLVWFDDHVERQWKEVTNN